MCSIKGDEKQLWDSSVSSGSIDDLVLYYGSWANDISTKLYYKCCVSGTDIGDFIQYGTLGLIESLAKFDPAKAYYFKSFAFLRVRGVVLNNVYKFTEYGAQYTYRYQREKDRVRSIVCNETKEISAEKFVDLTVDLAIGYMLEEIEDIEDTDHRSDAFYGSEYIQLTEHFKSLIPMLTKQQSSVIRLHYFQQLSFVDIARCLDLTRGRVSQLHAAALCRLNELYKKEISLSV